MIKKLENIPILEKFIPKDGYELQTLLCLSYSLDASVGIALLAYGLSYVNETYLSSNPSSLKKGELIRAINENLKKSLFVINGDGVIGKSKQFSGVEKILMDKIVKRKGRSKKLGSFHPKMILAIYADSKKNYYGKIYVGSKNLTFSTDKEFGVVLDLVQRGKNKIFHKSLMDFLSESVRKELEEKSHKDLLNTLLNKLKENRLSVDSPDINFYWQDRNKKGIGLWKQIFEKNLPFTKELGVISPWIGNQCLNQLKLYNSKIKKYYFWCLEKYAEDLKEKKFLEGKCKSVGFAEDPYQNTDNLQEKEFPTQSFHSKIYLFEGPKNQLAFGSANFTECGLGLGNNFSNTEILLEYQLKDLKNYKIEFFKDSNNLEDCFVPTIQKEDQNLIDIESWVNQIEVEWVDEDFPSKLRVLYPSFSPIKRGIIQLLSLEINVYLINELDRGGLFTLLNEKKVIEGEKFYSIKFPKDIPEHEISSLVSIRGRFLINNEEVQEESDKTAHIPHRFLNQRHKDLKVKDLELSISDCIESLGHLIEEPVKSLPIKGDSISESQNILTLLGGLTLDRFAYKMALYKKEKEGGQELFNHKIKRAYVLAKEIKEGGEELNMFKISLFNVLEALEKKL